MAEIHRLNKVMNGHRSAAARDLVKAVRQAGGEVKRNQTKR